MKDKDENLHKDTNLNDILGMSDEQLQEHAYLIDRGVRYITLLNSFESDQLLMLRMAGLLEDAAYKFRNVIPFVIDRENGTANCGFASNQWAIKSFVWADTVPEPHRSRVRGMLFGYSSRAIMKHEESEPVRCFRLFALQESI